MKSYSDLKVGTKIFSLALILLAFMAGSSYYATVKIGHIGEEIKDIAENDIPLVNVITEITVTQLEQAIWFERVLRFAEGLSFSKTTTKLNESGEIVTAADYDVRGITRQLKQAEDKFDELTKHADAKIIEGEKVAEIAIASAVSEAARREFVEISEHLKIIEREHADYEKHVHQLFDLIEKEQFSEMHKLAEAIEKEEEALDHELEKFLKQVELFTEESAKKAEADEIEAERAILFAAVGALAFGLFISLIVTRAIASPIVLLSKTIGEITTNKDLTLQVPVSATDEIGTMSVAFNEMMQGIRDSFGIVSIAAVDVESSSVDVATRAGANRKRAEEEMKRAQTSEKVITEMGNTAGQVSNAAAGQRLAAESSQNLLSDLVSKMQTVSSSATGTNKEANATIEKVSEMGETGAKVVASAQAQGDMVEQVTSSIGHMVEAVENMQSAVGQAQEHGKASLDAATEGRETIATTVKGMQAISESSEQISEIIGVITEIAEQTNLLALNAAVEAARAGAHGKGFAVVADEVGKLAQRSSEAAKEITQLIKESTGNVAEGVKLTDQSQQALVKIAEGGRINMQAIEAISNTSEILDKNTIEVKGQVESLNTLAKEIGGMAQEQGVRRTAAESALKVLLEHSNNITSLVNESNDSIKEMNKEMDGVVQRGNEMSELTGLQAQRSKAITKLSHESADAASQTVEGAGTVVGITDNLRQQSDNLTTQVQQFKI